MEQKNHIKNRWKIFFFPFYPNHFFRSIRLMSIMAILIALRIVLGFISITIPGINISLSICWVPLMIIGWIFGPIHGCITGMVTDSLCFLIMPGGVWFWMYAIQEPIVGLLAGILQGVCAIRLERPKPNVVYDILVEQICLVFFCIFSLVELLLWVDTGNITYFNAYKVMATVLIVVYFLVMEIFTGIFLRNIDKNKQRIIVFTYATVLVTTITIVFSFLLGPISAVEYLKYINGHYPDSYIKYGTIFYLIPRIIIESIKSPLEAFILTSSVFVINPLVDNLKNILSNQWENH